MKSPKVTKSTIEQEIDLGEIFGIDATDAPALKNALAQAIIDHIVSRTQDGKGMRFGGYGSGTGLKLKSPYSKEYQESLEFKAAGKKATEVNMTLTGDMLASLDVISTRGNKIKIGISDDLQILKAFNHITGDTVPERPWFGVNRDELEQIGGNFSSDFSRLRTSDIVNSRQQKLLDFIDRLTESQGADVVSVDDTFDAD